jgi:hypothetical protein
MFTKLFKNKNITLKNQLYFSIIFLLICFVSAKHELWTDEGYILISSVDYTLLELFDNYRYTGVFPLHNILIKIPYILTNNQILSLKIITILNYYYKFFIISLIGLSIFQGRNFFKKK